MSIELLNGDCFELIKQVPDRSIDFVLTDPPYEFDPRNNGGGQMIENRAVYKEILTKLGSDKKLDCGTSTDLLEELKRVFRNGYNAVFFCNQYQLKMYIDFAAKNDYRLNILVWHKTNPAPLCNNKYLDDIEFQVSIREQGLKMYGKYETLSRVFESPVNKHDKDIWHHPTMKPIELMSKYIINHTKKGDTVLDLYAGLGSTAIACKIHERNFIGFEIDKTYYTNALKRIEQYKVQLSLFD